jgi:hypothetical protein
MLITVSLAELDVMTQVSFETIKVMELMNRIWGVNYLIQLDFLLQEL